MRKWNHPSKTITFFTKNLHKRKKRKKPGIRRRKRDKRVKAASCQRPYLRTPAEVCDMKRIEILKMSILSSVTGSLTLAELWRRKMPKMRRSKNNWMTRLKRYRSSQRIS
jgi:hypothetical protein